MDTITLNANVLGNINFDDVLNEHGKSSSSLNYNHRKNFYWLAELSFDISAKDKFRKKFIDRLRDEDDDGYDIDTFPLASLEINKIYMRRDDLHSSYRYRDTRTIIFVVRDISDSGVTIELFQTPLKAYKKLVAEGLA